LAAQLRAANAALLLSAPVVAGAVFAVPTWLLGIEKIGCGGFLVAGYVWSRTIGPYQD